MSDQTTFSLPVDPLRLQAAIQRKIDDAGLREPHLNLTVERPLLKDGSWRTIVHRNRDAIKAEDYATVLAEIEEQVTEDFGVNVVLIPASE